MTPDELDAWLLEKRRRPLVVGVLNITPDSFSDGGQFLDPAAAIARGRQMLADGADWIDVGGESTRPGSEGVSQEEQLRRVIPVVRALRGEGTVVSIDTSSAAVANAALEAGVCVINDTSAATADPAMAQAMRKARAVVLMHMQGARGTCRSIPVTRMSWGKLRRIS